MSCGMFLFQLRETKLSDNSRTLLHFLAETMEKRHSNLAGFTEDFIHVQGASRVSAADVTKNAEALKRAVKKVRGFGMV